MVRVVLDTNTLVSGLLYLGNPKRVMDMIVAGKAELILSDEIIGELRDVLGRDKFKLSKEEQNELANFVIRAGTVIPVRSIFKVVKEDPDDDMILQTAYDGGAQYIVSGDRHLLQIGSFSGTRIVKPREALELL